METLNMYQIPRSIMHDPLPHHVAHHFVTFSLDRLMLPIDMTEFTPSLPSLYSQLPLHAQFPPLIGHSLLCMIAPTESYPLFAPTEFAPPQLAPLPLSRRFACACATRATTGVLD